ncbi:MAG: endonuclease/exonuclease/phosphatase family protein [Bacteroidales bacterium]|nr:endonuclease/exonuclease/phosphatase family protein [Bacteroidales bacterium]
MSKRIIRGIVAASFYFSGVLLLVSIFAPFFNPSRFAFFAFTGLLFPLLWILNVLFLLFFSIRKSRLAIAALVLLLTGVYQFSLIFHFPGRGEPASMHDTLNLISFNTGNADTAGAFNSRKKAFENELFSQSDIICLQEFVPENALGIDILESFNNKINVDYYGFENGDSSGLSVYTKYEITGFGWLKQEGEDTYALWCTLNVDSDTLTLINVQLQSIRLDDDELESMTRLMRFYHFPGNFYPIYTKLKRGFLWREEQVDQLKKLIRSSKYPVILCGDFNDPPSSFTYREISKLLQDAFVEKGKGLGSTYAGELPFLRIDYVMLGKGIKTSGFTKIGYTHSDHYPLFVSIGL